MELCSTLWKKEYNRNKFYQMTLFLDVHLDKKGIMWNVVFLQNEKIFFRFLTEGLLITCSYDYLSEDWNHKSFILYAFICNYCIPMTAVIFFYTQIVKAVVSHEAALKKQAAKMNVESLRSNVVIETHMKGSMV